METLVQQFRRRIGATHRRQGETPRQERPTAIQRVFRVIRELEGVAVPLAFGLSESEANSLSAILRRRMVVASCPNVANEPYFEVAVFRVEQYEAA